MCIRDRINIITSLLFVALLGASIAIGGEIGFFCMLAASISVTLIRSRIVVICAGRVCEAYAVSVDAARPYDGLPMPKEPT